MWLHQEKGRSGLFASWAHHRGLDSKLPCRGIYCVHSSAGLAGICVQLLCWPTRSMLRLVVCQGLTGPACFLHLHNIMFTLSAAYTSRYSLIKLDNGAFAHSQVLQGQPRQAHGAPPCAGLSCRPEMNQCGATVETTSCSSNASTIDHCFNVPNVHVHRNLPAAAARCQRSCPLHMDQRAPLTTKQEVLPTIVRKCASFIILSSASNACRWQALLIHAMHKDNSRKNHHGNFSVCCVNVRQ